MYRFLRVVAMALFISVLISQTVFAAEQNTKSSKPTEGIEATDPKHGTSQGLNSITPKAKTGLLSKWYCEIEDTGTKLYIRGSQSTLSLVGKQKLTLYLQKWDGSNWQDIKSWSFSATNDKNLIQGASYNYKSGSYYRTRAVHYAEDGSKTETQNSVSSYIYIN